MAKPINFAEANVTWAAQGDDIGELRSYREVGCNVSCWKLGWRERIRALWTGHVWLHIWAEAHPATYVSTDYPFKDKP